MTRYRSGDDDLVTIIENLERRIKNLESRPDKSISSLSVDGSVTLDDSSVVTWGGDTALYRSAANKLKTDDTFEAGTDLVVNGWPVASSWSSWTPNWTAATTNPTLGDGALLSRYKRIGVTVFIFIRLTWGTTTNGGAGAWNFSLPFESQFSNLGIPTLCYDNSGAQPYPAIARITTVTTVPRIYRIGAHSSTGAIGHVSATHPFTWASSDVLTISGTYTTAV